MKIIGFVASPRKNGNTAWTINQILEGAKDAGNETHIWYSSDININPCKGCLGCVQGDRCIVNDDMQEIYDALKDADALVLGSPIYMGQMTAQAKIFTDRLFAQITPRFSPHFKEENAGKMMVLAFTQGNPNEDMFKQYIDYTEKMFKLLEFDVKDVIIVTGTRNEPAGKQMGLQAILKTIGASLTKD